MRVNGCLLEAWCVRGRLLARMEPGRVRREFKGDPVGPEDSDEEDDYQEDEGSARRDPNRRRRQKVKEWA